MELHRENNTQSLAADSWKKQRSVAEAITIIFPCFICHRDVRVSINTNIKQNDLKKRFFYADYFSKLQLASPKLVQACFRLRSSRQSLKKSCHKSKPALGATACLSLRLPQEETLSGAGGNSEIERRHRPLSGEEGCAGVLS